MPSLGCLGDSRCALESTGESQVASWFVRVMILGGLSGDLYFVTLVALITLARTCAPNPVPVTYLRVTPYLKYHMCSRVQQRRQAMLLLWQHKCTPLGVQIL